MKTFKIILLIITLFVYCKVNAQSENAEIPIPKFHESMVVLRTLECTGYFDPTLSISDGSDLKYSMKLQIIKEKNEIINTKTLAVIFNQLKSQGYKLISSNSGGGDGTYAIIVTTYIFQKE